MSFIEFKNINKKYENAERNSVTDFNLAIEEKEFIAFVGPSGCGKSTTLRMVAGFEEITSGDLYIDGKRVNDVAPRDRGIAMVFQNYALYPHMTVEKNIGYGLRQLGHPDPGVGGIPYPEAEKPFRGPAPKGGLGACHCKKPEAVFDG